MTNNIRAIAALLEIMANKVALMPRRIEAAEALLGYEAPAEVVEQAKGFLAAVFEYYEHVCVDDRLEALKLMRKAEARKITQQRVRSTEADDQREFWRDVEIAARRMKLIKAEMWPAAPDWADDLLGSDYVPPRDKSVSDLFEDQLVTVQPLGVVLVCPQSAPCSWEAHGKQRALPRLFGAIQPMRKPQQWRTPSVCRTALVPATPRRGSCFYEWMAEPKRARGLKLEIGQVADTHPKIGRSRETQRALAKFLQFFAVR